MDIKTDIENRVKWIKEIIASAHAKGVIYGNSGGKDCTLVSAMLKMATNNVLGVIMPCNSVVNYNDDMIDAIEAGKYFDIPQITVDLSKVKDTFMDALGDNFTNDNAGDGYVHASSININPRLRMTTLYALAQSRGYLVAGTGNLDEITMGYFTKWGDGGYDFNPIADLTVTEVYDFLRYLKAPSHIIEKKPSAGLYVGQTDEKDLGVSYDNIDKYLRGEQVDESVKEIIEKAKARNLHKLAMPNKYHR